MDAYYEQPPIIRTLTAAVFVTSCAVYASGSLLYQAYFSVDRAVFMLPPELWRLITAFLISGPKLGIIMDPYFRTYGDELVPDMGTQYLVLCSLILKSSHMANNSKQAHHGLNNAVTLFGIFFLI